jgi:hypothetical protein
MISKLNFVLQVPPVGCIEGSCEVEFSLVMHMLLRCVFEPQREELQIDFMRSYSRKESVDTRWTMGISQSLCTVRSMKLSIIRGDAPQRFAVDKSKSHCRVLLLLF